MKKIMLAIILIVTAVNVNAMSYDVTVSNLYLNYKVVTRYTTFAIEGYTYNDEDYYSLDVIRYVDNDYLLYESELLKDSHKENISKIIYYGYGYENHTEDFWKYLTQYLIYKELYPENILYLCTFTANQIYDYDEYIEEIYELMNKKIIDLDDVTVKGTYTFEALVDDYIASDNLDVTYDEGIFTVSFNDGETGSIELINYINEDGVQEYYNSDDNIFFVKGAGEFTDSQTINFEKGTVVTLPLDNPLTGDILFIYFLIALPIVLIVSVSIYTFISLKHSKIDNI